MERVGPPQGQSEESEDAYKETLKKFEMFSEISEIRPKPRPPLALLRRPGMLEFWLALFAVLVLVIIYLAFFKP